MLGAVEGFIDGITINIVNTDAAEARLIRPHQFLEDQQSPGERHTALAEESRHVTDLRVREENRLAGSHHEPLRAGDNEAPTQGEIDALGGACQSVVDTWLGGRGNEAREAFGRDYVQPYQQMLQEQRDDEDAGGELP